MYPYHPPVWPKPALDDQVDPQPVARMEDELIDLRARVAALEAQVRDLTDRFGAA